MKLTKELLFNKSYTKIIGRYSYDKHLTVYNSDSGIKFVTNGTELKLTFNAINPRGNEDNCYISIVFNRNYESAEILELKEGENKLSVSLNGEINEVSILKNNEAMDYHLEIIEVETNGIFYEVENREDVLIIGDSTSAGYGVYDKAEVQKNTKNSNGLKDFIFMANSELGYDVQAFTASGWGIEASIWTKPMELPLFNEVDKVCIQKDIPYDYHLINPKMIFFSLGTNDFTYIKEKPELEEERYNKYFKTYTNLITKYHAYYPNAAIFLIYGSINEERVYNSIEALCENAKSLGIKNIYLARVHGDNLGCNGHPSLKAHYEMKEELKNIIINSAKK